MPSDFLKDHVKIIPVTLPKPKTYKSQAARDAQAANYGGPDYWQYLDDAAQEHFDYFTKKGDDDTAAAMFTQSLAEALQGNDGE